MKRQGGFAILIYLAIFAFIAAAGAAVVMKYNSAIEGRKDAEAKTLVEKDAKEKAIKRAEEWKDRAAQLQGDINARDKIVEAKNSENKDLRRELDTRKKAMAALAARDANAAAYLAAPVANGVRLQRRVDAGCTPDLSVQCAPRLLRPDSTTSAAGRDERGTPDGERRSAGGAR